MANLSNINNKFIVSDAGHVSIGATTTTYPLTVESGGVGTVLRAGTAFVSIDSVGTAASPSLIFNGDDNTGIFRAAADTLAFSTAGTERMRISASGNVGIGQAPSDFTDWRVLELKGLTNGSMLNFENSSSVRTGAIAMNDALSLLRLQTMTASGITFEPNNAEAMRIDSSGRVGIGITPNVNSSVVNVIQLGKGMTLLGNANDDRATMAANLYLDTGTAFRYVMDGLAGRFSIEDGQMVWGTAGSGTAGTVATVNTKMTLLNNGYLGIGTASPQHLLHLKSTISGPTGIIIENTNNAQSLDIDFWNNAGAAQGRIRYNEGAGSFDFFPNVSAVSALTMEYGGNVGIGTTSPQALLDVTKNSDEVYDFSQDLGQRSGTATIHINNNSTTVGSFGQIMYDSDGSNQGIARIVFIDSGTASVDTAFVNEINNTKKETLRIKANGNVGIGTDSPDLRLHVDGVNAYPATSGTTPNGMLHLRAKTAGGSHGLYMGVANASPWGSWLQAADASNLATEYPLLLNPNGGNVGIGITSPNTKLDVSGTTGTRNRNTQGSSVYETSLYFNAAGNATTNISIDTTTAFPPIASGGFILVEVSASGYGNSGSNGLVFSYISGGYGGHYGGQGQPYHPVEIIANTMQAGSCTFYYPNSTTIGIAVTTTNSVGLNGLMRVKVTSTY